jgi:hypothetical protein
MSRRIVRELVGVLVRLHQAGEGMAIVDRDMKLESKYHSAPSILFI